MANANYKYQNGDDSQRIIPIFVFFSTLYCKFPQNCFVVICFFCNFAAVKRRIVSVTDRQRYFF